MGILFHCPHCQNRLNVKQHQAGEEGLCPECGGELVVPRESVLAPSIVRKSEHSEIKPGSDAVQSPDARKLDSGISSFNPDSVNADGPSVNIFTRPDSGGSEKGAEKKDPEKKLLGKNGDDEKRDKKKLSTTNPARPGETNGKGQKKSASDSKPKKSSSRKESSRTSRSAAAPPAVSPPIDDKDSFLLGKPENRTLSAEAPDLIESGLKKVWYVRHPRNGETGPIKGREIERMLREKKIVAGCFIWREDWEDWEPAASAFPQLATEKSESDSKVFCDPGQPIPRAAMKKHLANQARRKRQIRLVIAIIAGLATIVGLTVVLFRVM